ncbi:MAG TPA: ABC transporter substrate-binding protein [Pusillimonas sp.]|uniref:ABC transporter substrate-binding protein n=1 Tax=unclassified Pusillimonas TaxID=2640016 RepID=UPI00261D3E31|nr:MULTISPECIES: ABC transporter substrate-binding protein [unclassified Pusillimonas]HLU19018.1 ABC transporter substrate-binding protein [Pusillimonas sp.]
MIPRLQKLAAALLLASSSICTAAVAAEEKPIKIGFVAELSGPQAALGQDQYDALMLLIEQRGGKLGGFPVEVLREDSQLKPEIAVQVTQKLIERDNVDLITGLTFTPTAVAASKVAIANEVFVIASNGSSNAMAGEECSPFVFVVSWQPVPHVAVLSKYADQQGYKRVSLMGPNYATGKNFLSIFKDNYSGTIVDEIYTPMSQQDFSAELLQLSASKPDAVFVFYPGGLGINFVRQYRQSGLGDNIPLMALGALDGTNLPALGDAALGFITGSTWAYDMDNESNRTFVEGFEKKYGRIPTMMAAQGYDAALLIDSAIAKVNGKLDDKEAFRAALKEADFKTVRGKFRFGNNQFPIQDFHILEIKRDAKGRVNQSLISTPMVDAVDPFASQCNMS